MEIPPSYEKVRRPASHRWAIGIFSVMTLPFVILMVDVFSGRSGATPKQYSLILAFLSVGTIALFCLVLGGRRRWVYYVSSCSLAVWAARATYVLSLHIYYFLVGAPSVRIPYFHLLQRDKPLAVEQTVAIGRQISLAIGVGLLVLLFVRFTFGRPSRHYFGFVDGENSASLQRMPQS